ncbi:MAG: hypothetical protein ACTHMM_04920 [Agriterribacter sp.]
MKRIHVLSMALLLIAGIIGLSAFVQNSAQKPQKNKSTSLYWYEINTGHGDKDEFLNSEVTIMSLTPSETPPEIRCETEEEEFKCVIGIDPIYVNSGTGALNDVGGTTRRPYVALDQYRTSQ